jgi:hypothetical protein
VSSETYSEIKLELSSLHKLLDTYCTLLEKVRTLEPNDVELLALAGILHSFYSGLENIFKRIAGDIDGNFVKTGSWHSVLLENMAIPTPKRSAVISEILKKQLQFYLNFRHVFRGAYSYDLNWQKMKSLVLESEEILLLVEKELNEFMKSSGR